MGVPEPDAGRRAIRAGAASGSSGSSAEQAGLEEVGAAPAGAGQAGTRPAGAEQAETGPAERTSAAVVIVPTLLGLLGFFAVSAAVTAEEATVSVTVPGLLLALTAMVVAGVSPLYAVNPTWGSLRRPAFLLAACLLMETVLFLFAPEVILFSLPALPLALCGGGVLLSTSLWGQFRKGPAPEPVLLPRHQVAARSFTSTLLVVAVNWALFLAAGALCAWLLLGD
ncbi:hypothetical protein [Arthrobacter sp. zg-Y895]|uniref:hypothetical protein n=1 Tax=Arthrobacter sp. zg-Y895 TaxID=2886933 RepID=UPI001D1367D1|nr:hypothetical protein [Arthrobacter sp. zg-Y895]MCC3300357.1 hypothetical protein [Arthrobacter sp. zg-Y895]